MSQHYETYVSELFGENEPSWMSKQLAQDLADRDKTIQKYKDEQKIALHKDLLVEEIGKLQRLLHRNDDMITALMPGAAGLVIDIGELNDLLTSNRLQIDRPVPAEPIPSGKVFGG